MSAYLVLARKYRPRNFAEVIGQEVVTEILRGAIQGGHIGHAYLFCGPRGTGKTTLARILAKCLNCEKGPTAEPCGVCERCSGAENGSDVDIIEIDAASHTGVEDIRELRDEVAYAPMRARHKVYIVDEVHMLSKAAFNALLKTLEEPPAHVVFLFATTDPHKVLDTVLSRCQILRLQPLSEERIVARLEQVFAAEGVAAEPGVTAELARHARGGMRDALSQADKLLAFAGNAPKLADLHRLGGDTGSAELEKLLLFVERGERPALLTHVHAIEGDEEEVLDGLLGLVRAAAVLAWCGEETPIVALSGPERAAAAERGRRLGAERLELWMAELLRARERLRELAGQERSVLELVLLDLARAPHTLPVAELLTRLEALERRLASGVSAPPAAPVVRAASPAPSSGTPVAAQTPAASPRPAAVQAPAPSAPSAPSAPAPGGGFEAFVAELTRTFGALATLFKKHGAASLVVEGEGRVRVRMAGLSPGEERLLADKRNLRALELAYGRAFGNSATLEFTAGSGPARAEVERPTVSKDLFTQRIASDFEGTVEDLG
ncbi:MAG: DNA polymerase III subunit gamma/tau [Planctomycetota bacterium]